MKTGERENRGARDAAAILPFLSVVLFFPPIIYIFAAPVAIAGVPLIVLYLFGVWAAIILAAYVVSRRLKPDAEDAGGLADTSGRR
jgi:predicted Kef-type K+ transport protein